MEMDEPIWNPTVFTKNRTLVEAWPSQKSLQRKDGGTNDDGSDFSGPDPKE
jgi:hypothetical protein